MKRALGLIFILVLCNLRAYASTPNWMQICTDQEFAPYEGKIFTKEDFLRIISSHKDVFLCTISNKQIKFFGSFESPLGEEEVKKRLRAVLSALKYLNKELHLSNICFLISVEDSFSEDLPVLTFAKDIQALSLCIPDFEALRGYHLTDQKIQEGIEKFPLESKIEQAFWRGATTGGVFSLSNWHAFPRSQLVALSLKHPTELDARFSLLLQAKKQEAYQLKNLMTKHNMFAKGETIDQHLKYKFLIDIDGNSCTYSRLYWILKSNSLCIKQLSSHKQWYYPLLKAYVHYLPFSEDFSDLITQITWARQHPEKVKDMIERANMFAKDHLKHKDALMYLFCTLERYRKIIDYTSFLNRP